MRTLVLTAGLLAVSTAAPAQQAACQSDAYRAFDFWLGDWDVFDRHGDKAGESSIALEEQGCLLVEHWRSVTGGRGQSLNFLDPATGKWRQVFASTWGIKDFQGGLDAQGRMVLEGTIRYSNGVEAPFRGTWTPNEDGTVTQYLQELDGETGVWNDWFEALYRRKAEPTP